MWIWDALMSKRGDNLSNSSLRRLRAATAGLLLVADTGAV